jgi:propionyl-CoA carboxylase alpha chain
VRNFLPSTGRLITYRPPAEDHHDGVTVRNDTGVYEGGEISIYYDPMIAKLVTHAGDRMTAIDAQADALDRFAIDGIRHNIPFLASIMQKPRWRSGTLSTGFIAEEYPDGISSPPSRPSSITSPMKESGRFPGRCGRRGRCNSSVIVASCSAPSASI